MGSPRSTDAHLPRRTIVSAAAWTVPALSVAVGAPLAVASPACPSFNNPTDWVGPTTTAGTGWASDPSLPGQQNRWRPYMTGREAWFSGEQNNAVTPSTSDWVYYIETTFQATAGRSYNLNVLASATESTSANQLVDISVGGTVRLRLMGGSTPVAGYTTLVNDAPGQNFSFTHAATVTGPVTVRYTFTLKPRFTATGRNADLRVGVPLVTCTWTPAGPA